MTDGVREANLAMLRQVAIKLGPVRDEVVFVGGITTALFLTDPGAAAVRATDDVDVIAKVVSQTQYYELAARLRRLGFAEDPEGPVCRWRTGHLIVDVMPLSSAVLGFANRWYPD